MPETKALEQEKQPSVFSEVLRYVIVLALVVVAIWYYYFNKPAIVTLREAGGKTMGTVYSVKVADFPKSDDPEPWRILARSIQDCVHAVDSAMSTFKDDSDVSRFNVSNSTDWFEVSRETAEVVRLSLDVSELTDGAFDITVGPLVDLWGFGPEHARQGTAGIEQKALEIRDRVGYRKLEVRLEPPALKKSIPELRIDLSAIAKGFAVDRLAALLDEQGFKHYMIEVGGEVRCRGDKGNAGPWKIGIERPLILPPTEFPGLQRIIVPGDNALATSGDYQNYRELDGIRYSHIIDPRTGFPTERIPEGTSLPVERLGSVSVVDTTCARADALATALFVLGEQAGLQLARQQGLKVLFLYRTENVEAPIREAGTEQFPKSDKMP